MTDMSVAGELVIGRRHIPYSVIRSDNTNKVKLEMTMDGFNVTAPGKAAAAEIEKTLRSKKKWIIENYAELQKKYEEAHKIARFRTGAKLPYWGRLISIRTHLADVPRPRVRYENAIYIEHPNYSSAEEHDRALEAAIHHYLKSRFDVEVKALIKRYSNDLDVKPNSVKVTEMIRRWGSCSSNGNISLDWRLVYAPKRVLSYVVAHELAHLKVNDHSQKFWNLLKKMYGEFEREHAWLMKNEHLLGYKKLPLK